jgi:hypothetical protein
VGFLERIDHAIVRLNAFDDRHSRKRLPKLIRDANTESEPSLGRWRAKPLFYWRHEPCRLDFLALIFGVGGFIGVVRSVASTHLVSGLGWLGVVLAGVVAFLLASLDPG